MEVIAKLKEKKLNVNDDKDNTKLVLLLWKKGDGLEYSVHTEIKEGEYYWGHYFSDWQGNGLESALKYYEEYNVE